MTEVGPSWRQNYPFVARIEGDLIYGGLLITCVIISVALRKHASLEFRKKFDGIIGLLITIVIAKSVVFYSLIVVLAHLVLYKVVKSPTLLGNISFYGTFIYLGCLRCAHFIGLPKLEFVANAIQLILTLRIIGLSYEIADTRESLVASKKHDKDTTTNGNNRPRRYVTEPTSYEAFNYLYSFTGLFTGPYYTYQTYVDAVNSEHLKTVSISKLVTPKLWTLSWTLPLLILFYVLGPVEILKTDAINEYSFLTLIILCSLAFIYLRMRIYTAWMIAESICISSGIGIYPNKANALPGIGPRDLDALETENGRLDVEYDAETINNLNIPQIETSDGFRSGMRAWNMTVQFWLANFVYKRTRRSIRMPYTMFISAFWHGIHPGYFLSFLTIPLCTAAEDILFNAVKINPVTGKRNYYFELTWRFIRMRGFELMASGFLLLAWTDTVRFWNSVYWWLHLVMLAILSGAYVIILTAKKNHTSTQT